MTQNVASRKLIKVCGMRNAANIDALTKLQIDFIGFIFYPKSPRYIFEGDAGFVAYIPERIQKTIVSVDLTIKQISFIANDFNFMAIQLHGNESVEYCKLLRKEAPYGTIFKAFGVDETFDFETLKPFENEIDYFLFDTKSASHGGTGKKFNWRVLDNYALEKPFFLSGGIGLEDAAELKNFDHPHCVGFDINSRFEIAPAVKNIDLINQFIQIINPTA